MEQKVILLRLAQEFLSKLSRQVPMKKLLLVSVLCMTALPAYAATATKPAAPVATSVTTNGPTVPLPTSFPASPTNNLTPAYPQQIAAPPGSPASAGPNPQTATTTVTQAGQAVTPAGQLATTPTGHTFADLRDHELKDMDVRITALQRHEQCVRSATTAAGLSACPAVNFCGNAGVR